MISLIGNQSPIQMNSDGLQVLTNCIPLLFHQGLGSWKLLKKSPRPFPIPDSGPTASHPVNNRETDTKIQIIILFKTFIAVTSRKFYLK